MYTHIHAVFALFWVDGALLAALDGSWLRIGSESKCSNCYNHAKEEEDGVSPRRE